jgi:hypothetical protein
MSFNRLGDDVVSTLDDLVQVMMCCARVTRHTNFSKEAD